MFLSLGRQTHDTGTQTLAKPDTTKARHNWTLTARRAASTATSLGSRNVWVMRTLFLFPVAQNLIEGHGLKKNVERQTCVVKGSLVIHQQLLDTLTGTWTYLQARMRWFNDTRGLTSDWHDKQHWTFSRGNDGSAHFCIREKFIEDKWCFGGWNYCGRLSYSWICLVVLIPSSY